MPNIFSNNYLARHPVDLAMKKFSRNFNKDMKVLDVGCGNKPYAKYFNCKYVGLDPFSKTKADIIADAWEIPVPDNEFDGVILNQSLEHIKKTTETIAEIKRILKPGGLGIVTVPQTMKNHSIPNLSSSCELNNFDKGKIKYWNVDFYRFTKFGLIYLFRDFQILELKETSGYFGTIFQLLNYFLAMLKPIEIIFFPLYFIFNITGLFLDNFFAFLKSTGIKLFSKFYEIIYSSLTLDYILIIKNEKKDSNRFA